MSVYKITVDLNGRVGEIIVPNDATRSELQMMKEFLCKAIDTRIECAKIFEIKANTLKADIYDIECVGENCTGCLDNSVDYSSIVDLAKELKEKKE